MSEIFYFQLDDLKVVKLLICTPEFSSKVKNGAHKSKFSSNNDVKIVCLGKADGCDNLFDLLKEADEKDATNTVEIEDVSKEILIIFWSSGTTGITLFLFLPNILNVF